MNINLSLVLCMYICTPPLGLLKELTFLCCHNQLKEDHDAQLREADSRILAACDLTRELLEGRYVPLLDGSGELLAQRDMVVRRDEEEKWTARVAEMQKEIEAERMASANLLACKLAEAATTYDCKLRESIESFERKAMEDEQSSYEKCLAIAHERDELRGECDKLKNVIAKISSKIDDERKVIERERGFVKDRHDQELQEAKTEMVKVLALCKSDQAAALHRHQVEVYTLRNEYESKHSQLRAELAAVHTIETEHITQLYKTDIKRMQAQLDIRRREETTALKSLHEAEIRRVLRDCERLKRLVARAGGVSVLASVARHIDRDPTEAAADPDPEPCRAPPSPTPRASLMLSPAMSTMTNRATNWGALDISIAAHEYEPEHENGRSDRENRANSSAVKLKPSILDIGPLQGSKPKGNFVAEMELDLDMLNTGKYTSTYDGRSSAFTELQDYLEEEGETRDARRTTRTSSVTDGNFGTRSDKSIGSFSLLLAEEEKEFSPRGKKMALVQNINLIPGIEIIPSDVVSFHLESDKEAATVISITNSSIDAIIFKVTTTQPALYSIRPNQYFLRPGDDIDVELILIMEECNKYMKCYPERQPPRRTIDDHLFRIQMKSISSDDAHSLAKYLESVGVGVGVGVGVDDASITSQDKCTPANLIDDVLSQRGDMFRKLWLEGEGNLVDREHSEYHDNDSMHTVDIMVKYF